MCCKGVVKFRVISGEVYAILEFRTVAVRSCVVQFR